MLCASLPALSPAFLISLAIAAACGALTVISVLGIERWIPWPRDR